MTVSQNAPQGAPINQLIPLDFEDHPVRVVLDEHGAPWFHANDICGVLGHANPWDAVAKHVDQDDLAKHEVIDSLGRTQQANFINESGLYALIFGSTKPEAKRFKRWVTSEVLPAIRKTGGFGLGQEVREALADVADQIGQLAANMKRPVVTTPPPSRAELKARYNRSGAMDFHQAVQPIHLEYGQAWTTSLAIAQACDLNHPVLVEKIRRMTMEGKILASEYASLRMTSTDQWGSMIHGYQLSESGLHKVIALLGTLDLAESAHVAIRAGAGALTEAFSRINRKAPRGRRTKENDAFVSSIATLGEALTKAASTLSRQGGQDHG